MKHVVFPRRPVVALLAIAATAVLSLAILASGARAEEQLYTCAMHPQVIKREPGKCPICGMELTPIRQNSSGAGAGERKVKYYKSSMVPGEVSDKQGKDSMGMDRIPVYEEGAGPVQTASRLDAVTIQRMNLKTARVSSAGRWLGSFAP